MTLSIKNGGYAFLIRLDLMFSMSLCGFGLQKNLNVKKINFIIILLLLLLLLSSLLLLLLLLSLLSLLFKT